MSECLLGNKTVLWHSFKTICFPKAVLCSFRHDRLPSHTQFCCLPKCSSIDIKKVYTCVILFRFFMFAHCKSIPSADIVLWNILDSTFNKVQWEAISSKQLLVNLLLSPRGLWSLEWKDKAYFFFFYHPMKIELAALSPCDCLLKIM